MTDKREHRYQKFWDVKEKRIIECEICGFRHVDPLPEPAELAEFYASEYYRGVKPVSFEALTDEMIKEGKRLALEREAYREIFSRVKNENQSDQKVMLDIGCGMFILGYYFSHHGWSAYALEPSVDMAGHLRRCGLEVFNLPIEDINKTGIDNVGFVNMEYVLEHLLDPVAALQQIYSILAPGGILRVCVPNDFSPGQSAYLEYYNEQPDWVCLPDHVNYFDFSSLSKLLERIGFEPVYRTTTFPLEVLLLAGMNYYSNEDAKKQVGPFIANFETAMTKTGRAKELATLYECFAQAGFGRHVIMMVRKPR